MQELQKKEQEEPRRPLAALKRAHKTLEEANKQKEQELVKFKKVMKNLMKLEEKKLPNTEIFSNKAKHEIELQKKEQDFGMLIVIIKIGSRDGNFFKGRDMIIKKAKYDPDLQKKVKQEGLCHHEEFQHRVSE